MKVACIAIVLITAISSVIIMKNVDPNNRWYPFYVAGITILAMLCFTGTTS